MRLTEAAIRASRADTTKLDRTNLRHPPLRLIAQGHSHQEIATKCSLDVARVLAIRAAAASKIGVSSRVAIVRYAQTRGWLQRS